MARSLSKQALLKLKNQINFLPMKTWASKVVHNRPKPFFHSPAHSPQPRIDFSYYKYVPRHICLLISASPSATTFINTLLSTEDIWFKCNLYLRFIPPITLWKICIDLRPFSKNFRVPFSRILRSTRSNNIEI